MMQRVVLARDDASAATSTSAGEATVAEAAGAEEAEAAEAATIQRVPPSPELSSESFTNDNSARSSSSYCFWRC